MIVLYLILLNFISPCQEVENYYSNKGAEEDLRFLVNFDGDVVTLDIPMDGTILPSGWSIQPMVYPTKVSL